MELTLTQFGVKKQKEKKTKEELRRKVNNRITGERTISTDWIGQKFTLNTRICFSKETVALSFNRNELSCRRIPQLPFPHAFCAFGRVRQTDAERERAGGESAIKLTTEKQIRFSNRMFVFRSNKRNEISFVSHTTGTVTLIWGLWAWSHSIHAYKIITNNYGVKGLRKSQPNIHIAPSLAYFHFSLSMWRKKKEIKIMWKERQPERFAVNLNIFHFVWRLLSPLPLRLRFETLTQRHDRAESLCHAQFTDLMRSDVPWILWFFGYTTPFELSGSNYVRLN